MEKINIKELLEKIKKDGIYFDGEDIIDLVVEFAEHSNLADFIKYSILYNINAEEIGEEILEEIENIASKNDLIESEEE